MNFSKTIRYPMLLLFMMVIASACAGSGYKLNMSEYHEGRQYADQLAKQDARGENCFNLYPNHIHSGKMFTYLQHHLKEIKKEERSESYITGFTNGYKRNFREYMDLYCGD
jgi:hypothetical protein